MPVYSLYSFHRTFIPGFEYLTPSGLVQVDNFLSRINLLKCLLFFYCHPSRCQFIVYTLFTELLSQVSSTWPHCGPIQLVDHVLVRKDFWIFWITSHMFSAPFSLLLLYHKKQWKRNRNPGIYKGFQTWYRVSPPPFLLVCIDVLCNHSVGLNAFGCSISSPDMSQSNCCQVNCFTSNWFLGQRNLPWTSIRLYSNTNPSDSQSKALILSQRFPQKRYRALRFGSIWSWSSTIAHSPSMDFRISVLPVTI